MNHQDQSEAVRYWADNQLVVSGNHCRLFDNYIPKNIIQFDTSSVLYVLEECHQFFCNERIA